MEKIDLSNRFSINKKISFGAFGEIYRGLDKKYNNEIIIKLEQTSSQPQLLQYEAKILEYLKKENKDLKIPSVIYYNTKGDYNYMVMDYLGNSLEDIKKKIKKPFNIFIVCKITILLLRSLKEIHELFIIHRDLKPENILFDKDVSKWNTIYTIDFGLSKRYIDSNMKHIPYSKKCGFRGTYRYASLNMHDGIQSSRRDDLESLIYIIIYLIKGKLPWQHLESNNEDCSKKIADIKRNISIDLLFYDIPVIFLEFYKKIKKLRFDENPMYDNYILAFQKYLKENNIPEDLTLNEILNNNYEIKLKKENNNNNEELIKKEIKPKGFKKNNNLIKKINNPEKKINYNNKIDELENKLLNMEINKGPIINNFK